MTDKVEIKENKDVIQEKLEKELKDTLITEEDAQLKTVKHYEKEFFDEDDEIIEVNWD